MKARWIAGLYPSADRVQMECLADILGVPPQYLQGVPNILEVPTYSEEARDRAEEFALSQGLKLVFSDRLAMLARHALDVAHTCPYMSTEELMRSGSPTAGTGAALRLLS